MERSGFEPRCKRFYAPLPTPWSPMTRLLIRARLTPRPAEQTEAGDDAENSN